jgi:hypothetical protein
MRVWPALKTGILVVLVGTSLVLSEELWTGGWGGVGEVSYSSEPSLPQASVPTEFAAITPCRVVLTGTNSSVSALFMPGTEDYKDWMARLGQAHIFSLHVVSSIPKSMVRSVEFDFGVNMSYQELIHYVPGLQPSVLPKQGQTVYLYQSETTGPVMLGLVSQAGTYVAQTDLSVSEFSSMFHHAIVLDPWEVWNRQADSFVPKNSIDMFRVDVSVTSRSVIPLVHSFFVNPQALTSVPESQSMILWTDGSRAVWWDEQKHTLTYADPNLASSTTSKSMAVTDILTYASSHGGAADGSILFQTSVTANNASWTLRPYAFGFPIVSSDQSVVLQSVGSHVAKYQLPVNELRFGHKTLVHIIGASQLATILRRLMPTTPVSELSVELGYTLLPANGHTNQLEPAYIISQSGMPLWEIDAVSGQVLKGMKIS